MPFQPHTQELFGLTRSADTDVAAGAIALQLRNRQSLVNPIKNHHTPTYQHNTNTHTHTHTHAHTHTHSHTHTLTHTHTCVYINISGFATLVHVAICYSSSHWLCKIAYKQGDLPRDDGALFFWNTNSRREGDRLCIRQWYQPLWCPRETIWRWLWIE